MKRPARPVVTRLALGLGGVLVGAAVVGRVTGWRRPVVAVALHAGLMRWAVDALPATQPALTAPYYRVRHGEPALYRRLGVYGYMRLLRRVGWERFRRSAVGFTGRRAALGRLNRATREAETNHVLLGLLGLILAAVAARRRWWDAAAWQVVLVVLLHGYPVMLQRTLRARVTRPEHG
ncbi:hypothetical protein [uncultured Deinococcus sp.]|uniref:glycosyl-4,4'-diaponeurosporenoate acyltransferase CrtO family protein n=1 Tax=uncultured Deinococcus sp. TaxID=158789 RepID=UPI0025F52631|nr:hypothetical protein [uncultured Deinococcus sp.]